MTTFFFIFFIIKKVFNNERHIDLMVLFRDIPGLINITYIEQGSNQGFWASPPVFTYIHVQDYMCYYKILPADNFFKYRSRNNIHLKKTLLTTIMHRRVNAWGFRRQSFFQMSNHYYNPMAYLLQRDLTRFPSLKLATRNRHLNAWR